MTYDEWKTASPIIEPTPAEERRMAREEEVEAMLREALDGFDADIAEFTFHREYLSVEVAFDAEDDDATILKHMAIDLRTVVQRLERKAVDAELRKARRA